MATATVRYLQRAAGDFELTPVRAPCDRLEGVKQRDRVAGVEGAGRELDELIERRCDDQMVACREIGQRRNVLDAIARLHGSGLIHRCGDFVFASQAARRARELDC